jgi:uncharacterized Fe-S cluster-containing protein
MPRNTIKKQMTLCGTLARAELGGGRAKVIARDGNKLTYRWPCGYERTEVLMQGVGRLKKPMGDSMIAMFARYWAQGVTYECPRCRRLALAAAKKR